jgi:hypothetical protein
MEVKNKMPEIDEVLTKTDAKDPVLLAHKLLRKIGRGIGDFEYEFEDANIKIKLKVNKR